MFDLKGAAAAEATAAVCSLGPRLPKVAPSEPWQSLYQAAPQPAIGIRVFAKQTLANGVFNERERILGFSCFGFSRLGPKLYGRQLIFLGYNTRLGVLKRSASTLQLMFGGDDKFTLRPLGGLSSHFGKPQSF